MRCETLTAFVQLTLQFRLLNRICKFDLYGKWNIIHTQSGWRLEMDNWQYSGNGTKSMKLLVEPGKGRQKMEKVERACHC